MNLTTILTIKVTINLIFYLTIILTFILRMHITINISSIFLFIIGKTINVN